MTVTTPDRSVVNASGSPKETRSGRRRAPEAADTQGRHRAAASAETGAATEHRAAPSAVPASEAGFQSYSMFSGSRPANTVPVYRSAAGHGAAAQPGAAGTARPSTSSGERARAPRQPSSPGRVVRPASATSPGSQRPAAAPGRAASTPRRRQAEPGSAEPSAFGRPSPGQRPTTPSRRASEPPATPPSTGATPVLPSSAPAGAHLSTTEAELSALLLGGTPTGSIDTSSPTQAGLQKGGAAPSARPGAPATARSGAPIVARPGDPNAGTAETPRVAAPPAASARRAASAPYAASASTATSRGRPRAAEPSARSAGSPARSSTAVPSRTSAASAASGARAPSAASASGAPRRRPVFAPGSPSASSAGTTGSVGILPSPATTSTPEGTATYRVVVANQQVAVTAAHEAPGAGRGAAGRPASAPVRAAASDRTGSGERRPSGPVQAEAQRFAAPPPASPARGATAPAVSAGPASGRPAAAAAVPAPSSETASRPTAPAPASSARTSSGPQGREVWSREENLAWVTLSESAPAGRQAYSHSHRNAPAGRRSGVPTAVKVIAVLVLVVLIVLAGLLWVAPTLFGLDFSLSHIIGSLLGGSAAGASPPLGLSA